MHFFDTQLLPTCIPNTQEAETEDQEFKPACLIQRAFVIYKQIKENIL